MSTIIITAILSFGFFTGYTQSDLYQVADSTKAKNAKAHYSFMWGLFKSKDYKEVSVKPMQVKTRKMELLVSDDVENKRALWGAIQWTEKKKPLRKTIN